MPLYEFRCESCGARFEELAPVGTKSVTCVQCTSERTVRVLSAPAPPARLVRTKSDARKRERRNAALQSTARSRFKKALKPVHEAKKRRSDPGSGGG